MNNASTAIRHEPNTASARHRAFERHGAFEFRARRAKCDELESAEAPLWDARRAWDEARTRHRAFFVQVVDDRGLRWRLRDETQRANADHAEREVTRLKAELDRIEVANEASARRNRQVRDRHCAVMTCLVRESDRPRRRVFQARLLACPSSRPRARARRARTVGGAAKATSTGDPDGDGDPERPGDRARLHAILEALIQAARAGAIESARDRLAWNLALRGRIGGAA